MPNETITIMTCDRQPSYLSQTLETLPPDFPVELFFQTDSESDINFNGRVVKVDKPYKNDATPFRNSQYNYAKTLIGSTSGLIIEDDVRFGKKFGPYLGKIKESIVTNKLERYAIALYSWRNWEYNYKLGRHGENPSAPVHPLVTYPIDWFWCTQGMLYDLETARKFGEYLLDNIGKEAYDVALRTYIRNVAPSTRLLAATYSLVQHIGVVTTGLGIQFHSTDNFIDLLGDIRC